ncbi:uncharacterized protein A4U43_C10F16890 [Asparagus officinalis]|uniref:E2F transcription factor CC-MB domain-containing protein n=1 Tax=Asparagus officinalis TaxID=4686 RepID=A0A5P1E6L3_ASPOF|nr:uncharacterized protein A4U43_C10F16890 [Asparagus officinalis]
MFLPCFKQDTEDPQRRYRLVLRSETGPIDVYLVSKFEETIEQISGVETSENILPVSNPSFPQSEMMAVRTVEESRGKETEFQGVEMSHASPNFLQESIAGMMKIVPSEVDTDADYWLLSDADISISDMWKTVPDAHWDVEPGLNAEDFLASSPQTPTAGVLKSPSVTHTPRSRMVK